ncbi:MAG: M1 family aminopeptidase [Odoribacter sp.]
MKNSWLIIGVVFCLLGMSGCGGHGEDVPERGVSRELALQRKAEIKDLRYALKFWIPQTKSERVTGVVNLSFSLEEARQVVLDFREGTESLKSVKVNGREVVAEVVNEHIVISAEEMKAGRNGVEIDFVAGDQSLNRNDEYLYTLLVPDRARTLYPCMDQPDLKALFSLELEIPAGWTAVSNTLAVEDTLVEGRKRIVFAQTEPLSTYLFSFVAGRLSHISETRDGRKVTLYHRETDSVKLMQTAVIFNQVFSSLAWLEEYTGVAYPFGKYELIILPGFQYGGMEHTGATLYNDRRMFLSEHPTIEEELGRMELIAHETAHMWFGDYVTMAWFDDVWTKEVFANYFSARMTEPYFPQVNHRLNALRSFYASSYSEDRTRGTNAIKQSLGNLNAAGLVYGQIVYNKAPVVMGMLVDLMGEESFKKGIREYLDIYAYSNARWEDLVGILDRYTPEDLQRWSRVWVNERGMPEISSSLHHRCLTVRQKDRLGRGLLWQQSVRFLLMKDGVSVGSVEVWMKDSVEEVVLEKDVDFVLPNADGRSYGYFVLDEATAVYGLEHLCDFSDPVVRMSLVMSLNENRLNRRIAPLVFVTAMVKYLKMETDPLIISAMMEYVKDACFRCEMSERQEMERMLFDLMERQGGEGCQLGAFRSLLDVFSLPSTVNEIYRMWDTRKSVEGLLLNERDYMKMAYELAIRLPDKGNEIIDRQAKRIANPDRKKEFCFVARAVVSDRAACDSLFGSLLLADNRRMEPWTAQVMYYLNHPLREEQAMKYIRPALEELQEVQRTGDIFFPKNWVTNCLKGHNSEEAGAIVDQFLSERPDYPVLLKNKIWQGADHLYRR